MRVVILLRVVQVDHGIFSDFSNSQVSPSMFVDPDPKVSMSQSVSVLVGSPNYVQPTRTQYIFFSSHQHYH